MLQIRWRNWLTHRYVARWLHDDAYYRMQLSARGADNPDQRIQEDINGFVGRTLILSLGLLDSVVSLFSFAAILWGLSGTLEIAGFTIPGYMLWAAIVYAIAGTWLANRIGRPLIPLNFQQQKYEANLRFALVRLRENAEGVAFYGGEAAELQGIGSRLSNVVGNWWRIMQRQKILTWFSSGYAQIAIIFPFLVAAPRYFSGALQLGGLMQTAQAFGQVQTALSWFVTSYTDLADWKATVNRLSGFEEALSRIPVCQPKGRTYKKVRDAQALTLSNANIYLPDGVPLLTDLSLELPAGSRILVSGPSGSGKSTFLRTLSGIWPYFDGTIILPAGESMLFLPQKPYLPLGTIREAICYPDAASKYNDRAVRTALQHCELTVLARRLDDKENWALQLSPGEQQRIAFARAILHRPGWLFLDEATSALDEELEALLYVLVLETIQSCTIVSVAHRSSIAGFHDSKIVFSQNVNAAGDRLTKVEHRIAAARQAARRL